MIEKWSTLPPQLCGTNSLILASFHTYGVYKPLQECCLENTSQSVFDIAVTGPVRTRRRATSLRTPSIILLTGVTGDVANAISQPFQSVNYLHSDSVQKLLRLNSLVMEGKYLVIKGVAGMGNRILALLDGILYSQITGRKLIVDWSDRYYSSDQSNSFQKLFSKPNLAKIQQLPNTLSVYPRVWQGYLDEEVVKFVQKKHGIRMANPWHFINPMFWQKFSVNFKKIDYTEDVLVRWSFYSEIHKFRRYFQDSSFCCSTLSDEAILCKIAKENLVLSQEIQAEVDTFRQQHFGCSTVVGAHVRYTDRKTSLSRYYNILDCILKANPEALIFLATDNQSVQKAFRSVYGDKKVMSTSKWYPTSGSLHKNPECPDQLQNGVEALIDMYLLSSCNYLIFDERSTFGYIAKLLSNAPEYNVFDVSQKSFNKAVKVLLKQLDSHLPALPVLTG